MMRVIASILGLSALAACSNADFRSEAKQRLDPQSVSASCETGQEYSDEERHLEVKADKDSEIFMAGEFCPLAPAQLRLVFLIDFSLSMYNAAQSRGNDQIINGSCGRLEAAKAIVEKHRAKLSGIKSEVQVGVVQFASETVGTLALTSIDDFSSKLSTANFCKGLTGTNYKAAFDSTATMLADEPGTKVVYFISDGLPTEGGGGDRENAPRHRTAALDAVKNLRNKVDDLVLNTVYLGNVHDLDEENFDPEQFLHDLTGDPSRVKIVDAADKLAEEITTLENPRIVLDTATAEGLVEAPGADPLAIKFAEFAPHPEKDQVWTFNTGIFKAFPGTELQSELTITVKDKKGSAYKVVFTITPEEKTLQ